MAYTSAILGQAEREFEIYQDHPTRGNADLGKDAFLQLLVTQLTNQDPLNPMEDKEFVAQLTQFSSLEQLTNISEGIEGMADSTQREEQLSSVGYLGKDVRASGDTIAKSGDSISTLYFDLDEPIVGGYVNIFDSGGNILNTLTLGAMQAGTYQVEWDGTDYDGNTAPDGVYYTAMAAEAPDGSAVLVDTDVAGRVTGIHTDESGTYLRLSDGRVVNFTNVKEVVEATSAAGGSTDDTEESEESSES